MTSTDKHYCFEGGGGLGQTPKRVSFLGVSPHKKKGGAKEGSPSCACQAGQKACKEVLESIKNPNSRGYRLAEVNQHLRLSSKVERTYTILSESEFLKHFGRAYRSRDPKLHMVEVVMDATRRCIYSRMLCSLTGAWSSPARWPKIRELPCLLAVGIYTSIRQRR